MRLNDSRLVTTFFTILKAGPAGGRLRRPSSAGDDTTRTGEPVAPSTPGRKVPSVPASRKPGCCDSPLRGDAAHSSAGESGKQRTIRLVVDRRRRGSRRRGDGDCVPGAGPTSVPG